MSPPTSPFTHKDLDDFEPLVRNICKMAFTSGLRELENIGIKNINELKQRDYIIQKKFIKCCHKGYDKAQRKIAEEIIRLNKLKKQKELELIDYRKKHDKQSFLNLKKMVYVLDNRILVLRRIIDTIAFTLFQGKTWIGRRFLLLDEMKEIDTKAILSNLKEATLLNEQDRLKFAVVCDLTTFIDVGDLLQIDFHRHPAKWRIIELKEGKVNKILEDFLEKEGAPISEEKSKEFLKKISHHATKQAERMTRQKNRIKEIYNIVEKNEGIDIKFKTPIRLNENEILSKHYGEVLNKTIETTRTKGFHASIIDKCLILIAVKNTPDNAYHLLYHLLSPELDCAFSKNDSEGIQKEVKEMQRIPFTQNLTLSNMYSRSSTPFFSFPLSPDDMMDLLFNRISIIAHLDIEKFMKLGFERGFEIGLCSSKETHELLSQFGQNEVPTHNGKAVWVKTPNGLPIKLLGGTFTKIFHDLLRPSELFRMWVISSTELSDSVAKKEKGGSLL